MNEIKTVFTIKDLENLSGIKAHTIRIWEKRYHLLTPARTSTNIRYYDLKNLQKLLNVTSLYRNGLKISKIAALSEIEIKEKVRKQLSDNDPINLYLQSFKLAMLNFDMAAFNDTYRQLESERSFTNIFQNIFLPLLDEIGTLWQSDTITPAHEHFISNLIREKILINIERTPKMEAQNKKVFVLYLPINEIHELGLLYIHYELIRKGYTSIYLGQSVPMDNLKSLQKIHNNICYITYFIVQPATEKIQEYLQDFQQSILSNRKDQLWILGQKVLDYPASKLPAKITTYNRIEYLLKELNID